MKTAAFARATAVLATAFVAFAAASPAAAATPPLPEGDYLYTVSCDDRTAGLQLFAVDTATAALTAVGAGTPLPGACSYSPAWDYSTATAWDLIYQGGVASIGQLDLVSGSITSAVPVTIDGSPLLPDAFSIDMEGNAWLLMEDTSILDTGVFLYSLDLDTGFATYEGVFLELLDYVYGFAVDPTTGLLYGLEDDGDVWRLNTLDLTASLYGTANFGPPNYYGLQIDSNGVAWIETYFYDDETDEQGSELWSAPLDDLTTYEYAGLFSAPGAADLYTFAPLIAPIAPPAPPAPAALPNMGLDATPALVVGGLLLVAGGALVIARRRTASA